MITNCNAFLQCDKGFVHSFFTLNENTHIEQVLIWFPSLAKLCSLHIRIRVYG